MTDERRIGVVLGPNLTGPGGSVARSLGLPELSGPLLFSIVEFAVAAVVNRGGAAS